MISFTCLRPLEIGFLLSYLDMGLSDSIGCKQLETPGVPGLIMVPCFVLGEGCLTNVTSVCVRQGTSSFFYVAVVTAVGLGFELLPFLPFPFPWLLSEGERRRTGCRGSIPGRAGPHPFILPLPALVWQCAGSSLFAMALDRGRRMHSITEFPAFFPSGQRQNWMETKSRDLSSVVHTSSRFSKS